MKLAKFTAIIAILILLPGCLDMFFDSPEMKAALKSGDPEQCKLLINERNNGDLDHSDQWKCLRRMAEAKGDDSICDTIGDKNTMEYCYWDVAGATGNGLICQVEAIDKDRCYAAAAAFDNDINDCEQINVESSRESCIGMVAAGTQDIELCHDLSSQQAQSRCVDSYARENGAEHCDSSYLSEEEKVECVWMYAEKISDCEIIDNRAHFQKEYESCISQTAINEGKATTCMDLSDKERQNNCVTQVALKHDNPNACERLDFPLAAKEDCFVAYALAKNDPKVCKRLVDPETKKECEEATA